MQNKIGQINLRSKNLEGKNFAYNIKCQIDRTDFPRTNNTWRNATHPLDPLFSLNAKVQLHRLCRSRLKSRSQVGGWLVVGWVIDWLNLI